MSKFFRLSSNNWVDRDLVIGITVYFDAAGKLWIVRFQFSTPVFDLATEEDEDFFEMCRDTRGEAEALVARFLAGDPE